MGIATTLQTTTGQAFGARNFEEVSLNLDLELGLGPGVYDSGVKGAGCRV